MASGHFTCWGTREQPPKVLILHPGGASLLAKLIVWTEGTASLGGPSWLVPTKGTGCFSGDFLLLMGVLVAPTLHPRAWIRPCTMPQRGQSSRAASAAPARPRCVWWVLLTPAPLHCLSPGMQAGRAGVCEGDYSAFPLSPFRLLDKALAAGKPQLVHAGAATDGDTEPCGAPSHQTCF